MILPLEQNTFYMLFLASVFLTPPIAFTMPNNTILNPQPHLFLTATITLLSFVVNETAFMAIFILSKPLNGVAGVARTINAMIEIVIVIVAVAVLVVVVHILLPHII